LGLVDQILSGRLYIDDFSRGGPCKLLEKEKSAEGKRGVTSKSLVEDSKYSCDPRPARPQIFFDVVSTGPKKDLTPNRREKLVSEPTAGLYVDERDLSLVRKGGVLKYSSGAVPLKNGLPGGYLVWVDLNW
jgi:hypothetical protein